MFKNQFVQMIIEMQKRGINVHLTEDGYREFLKLINEEEMNQLMESAG